MSKEGARVKERRRGTLGWAVSVTLTTVSIAFVVLLMLRFGIAAPIQDQWRMVPLLEKSFRGTLTLYDLWVQHNEHRIVFPYLIMIPLARLTGWNMSYELGAALLIVLATFFTVVRRTRLTLAQSEVADTRWLIPIVSLIVFCAAQTENWLWGWQISLALSVLAVVAGIGLLAHPTWRWSRFACAVGLGMVATYSFANGMLIWIIGALLLLTVRRDDRQGRNTAVILWLVVGALTIGSYLYGYHKPPEHPPLWLVFGRPAEYVQYVLAYLGGTCVTTQVSHAIIPGAAGLALLPVSAWLIVRKQYATFEAVMPYLALGLYSLGSAMVTGIGRLGSGPDQALSSRYIAISGLLWVADSVLLYILAVRSLGRVSRSGRTAVGITATVLLLAIVMLVAANSIRSWPSARSRYEHLQEATEVLLAMDEADPGFIMQNYYKLAWLDLKTELMLDQVQTLKKRKLALWRER